MPILWRYLLTHFLKITFGCVLAFVAILLTMRLDEIAHFAALGAPPLYLFLFSLYQVPYILPIALPISSLIASLLLIQRLSSTHELTALRASGFSLFDLTAPVLLSAAFLSLANFWIASELATQSHLQTNLLKSELRSINPLLLLHNKHLMRLKGFYFAALGPSHVGESASDVVLAFPNGHQKRLHLMLAINLKATPSLFVGQDLSLITGGAVEEDDDYDHLLIENMKTSITHVQDFSSLLQRKVWTVNNDYLQLPLLLVRIQQHKRELEKAKSEGSTLDEIKRLTTHVNRSMSEIVKRFSISFAVFSFTLMGCACGLSISRRPRFHPLFLVIALTTLYLIAFFVAKGIDHHLWLTSALYIAPHALIVLASLILLRRISKGIE